MAAPVQALTRGSARRRRRVRAARPHQRRSTGRHPVRVAGPGSTHPERPCPDSGGARVPATQETPLTVHEGQDVTGRQEGGRVAGEDAGRAGRASRHAHPPCRTPHAPSLSLWQSFSALHHPLDCVPLRMSLSARTSVHQAGPLRATADWVWGGGRLRSAGSLA